MRLRWLSVLLAIALVGCRGDDRSTTSTTQRSSTSATVSGSDRELPPPSSEAVEVPLSACTSQELGAGGGGTHVHVAGTTCSAAGAILSRFTTAFSDENLKIPIVDRGNGWRCFQRLYGGGYRVQEVCWRGADQVIMFEK